jgi:hypothetical protein
VQVDSGSTASYVYDGSGDRVEKQTPFTISDYLYDDGQIATRWTNQAVDHSYVYLAGKRLADYFRSHLPSMFAGIARPRNSDSRRNFPANRWPWILLLPLPGEGSRYLTLTGIANNRRNLAESRALDVRIRSSEVDRI